MRPSNALVFIDPFNLNRATDARVFAMAAAQRGTILVGWYPLFRLWTPKAIQALYRRLQKNNAETRMLEVNWSGTSSQAMSGVGMLLLNLSSGGDTIQHLCRLNRLLRPLFGSGWTVSCQPRPRPQQRRAASLET
jgi:23S rRNA A2030 N6-methylase RlmJ